MAAINGIGFAFPDYPAVWLAMDGELGVHIRAAIAKLNLQPFGRVWDNGFRQITSSSRPINRPRDLDGFKIRVPVSPLYTSLFRSLGAAPAGLNLSEVYSALQTRIVDGQENPLAVFETAKLYQVQKYCAMTNHVWVAFGFSQVLAPGGRCPKGYMRLSSNASTTRVFASARTCAQLNEKLRTEFEMARGILFTNPDPLLFRERLREVGFYAEWRQRFGDEVWALLEQYVGNLT